MIADVGTVQRRTARTAVTFGYLWSRSVPDQRGRGPYHFEKLAHTLRLQTPRGLVLDAGCGDGIDLANHASRPDVEVVGVELSDGGCRTSAARIRPFATAHVVQADLQRLPFADSMFDRIYSYGVLHHVASPGAAARELARVARGDAEVAVYVYEDFSEQSIVLRTGLAIVNSTRQLTTRCPPRLLYALCKLASPVVYLALTVPYRLFHASSRFGRFVARLPYRHGRTPFSLAGDLYDRFSAPFEYRYSRKGADALLRDAGFDVAEIEYDRGWMVRAHRGGDVNGSDPSRTESCGIPAV